jgi:AraC-like DNA-binding protein
MRNATPLRPDRKTHQLVPRDAAKLERERTAWLRRLAPTSLFHRIFDYLPDLSFFAKDARGRLMLASRSIFELYGLSDDRDLVGLTDYDLNPDSMARAYTDDDERLLQGKTEVIERLELWFDRQGLPDWAHVTKLPLKDNAGRIVGVMGVLRPPDSRERQFPAFTVLSQAVLRMRRDFGRRLTIESLATECGLSVRAMQRQFRRVFGLTPQEFLLKTRVAAAGHLLRTTARPLSEISDQCGFSDQSAFTQQFKQRLGLTPRAFRQRGPGDSMQGSTPLLEAAAQPESRSPRRKSR